MERARERGRERVLQSVAPSSGFSFSMYPQDVFEGCETLYATLLIFNVYPACRIWCASFPGQDHCIRNYFYGMTRSTRFFVFGRFLFILSCLVRYELELELWSKGGTIPLVWYFGGTSRYCFGVVREMY